MTCPKHGWRFAEGGSCPLCLYYTLRRQRQPLAGQRALHAAKKALGNNAWLNTALDTIARSKNPLYALETAHAWQSPPSLDASKNRS